MRRAGQQKRRYEYPQLLVVLGVALFFCFGVLYYFAERKASEVGHHTFAPAGSRNHHISTSTTTLSPAAKQKEITHESASSGQHDDTSSPTLRVAVVVLITSSHRTPDATAGTLDGAFTLRQSVLRVLSDSPSFSTAQGVVRVVGLESYSAFSSQRSDGQVNRSVTVHTFEVLPPLLHGGDTNAAAAVSAELRFVALVTPDVPAVVHRAIEAIGYEVWSAHSPINASEIRNEQIRKETLVDGAMGIEELTKLEGLRMKMFDKVLMVDCDVMFHRRFDELLFLNATLGWTRGGWESEKMNGGFLVFSPNDANARAYLDDIVEVLREGDFRPGSGWKGKGIGWTYGGRTIQGVLPYYFFIEAGKRSSALVASGGTLVTPPAHAEISRCQYNNMVQLAPCKATPFENVTSNHFTGDCVKPWYCGFRSHPLCARFVTEWFLTYQYGLLNDEIVRSIVLSNSGLRGFAEKTRIDPNGSDCPVSPLPSLGRALLQRSS